MKHLVLIPILFASPAFAEEPVPPLQDLFKRLESLGQDSASLLDQVLRDLGPHLDRLGQEIGDLSIYEPPVVLENGDILIRRRNKPEPPKPDISDKDAIDL